MKIRTGFVSNSSSTSFYFDPSKISMEFLTEKIGVMLELYDDTIAVINPNGRRSVKHTNLTDILTMSITDRGQVYNQITSFYEYDGQNSHQGYCDRFLEEAPERIIAIDSMGDNSIPSEIQGFLEMMAFWRHHWG